MTESHTVGNRALVLELGGGEDGLVVRLKHRDGAWASPPVPLLSMEVCDRMQERVDRIADYRVMQVEQQGQALHVSVRDVFHGITVGVWLTMTGHGELNVLVPPAEVEEARDEIFRLYALDLMPGLMAAGADGTLLLPVNTGMLCRPAGKPKLYDRFLIYGEQERWELVPTLPVCGVQTPQGGLVAIATAGAHDMYCGVSTDGEGSGVVGLFPMFRREWIDPVDWGQREVRLTALAPSEDLVVTSAKRLRRHVIDDLGKRTLKQRAEESPECAYQQTAYTMKIFHGIQQQGIMMFGRESKEQDLLYKRTLTFRDAMRCFHRLKDAGIERIYFQSVGWNPKGHDGAWPTDLPIDQRLGGEADFRAMIEEAKSLGYHITTHLNMASAMFKSPDFHSDWVIHDIWGKPKVVGFWGGGVKSTHWGLAVPETFLRGRMETMRGFGFNGMQYLDGIGNPLYVNYHPVNGGSRRDHAAGINRYLDMAREVFGAVQTEMAFLYCVLHADGMCNPGSLWHVQLCKPEWPVAALLDERVPVWHLALHDLVTLENHGVGWAETMRCVLFGGVPRDEWTSEPGVFPVLDDGRIARLKVRYDLCCERFGRLITQELTEWKRPAEGVERTRFADGTEVVADFGEGRLTVNDEEIAAPDALRAAAG